MGTQFIRQGEARATFLDTLSPESLVVRSQLEELLRVRVQDPAATIGRDLRFVGVTDPITKPELVRSEEFGAWYFVDGFDDPTIEMFGGQPIPDKIRRDLRNLANTGIQLDRIWIGHEVPPDWRDGAPRPQLVPDQPKIRGADEILMKVSHAVVRGAAATGRGVVKGTALTVAGAGLVAGSAFAAGGAVAGLDPVLLGGVDHPSVPATGWVLLAQWDWPEE